MIQNYLSNRIKLVWFAPFLGLILFLWIVAFLGMEILNSVNRELYLYSVIATMGIGISGLIYTHLRFNNFTYTLGEEEITIRKGILEKRVDVVRYTNIQHIRTERTFLENLIGLVHIHLETSGSVISEEQPKIPGLPSDDHEELIEFINEKIRKTKRIEYEKKDTTEKLLRGILFELKKLNENVKGENK